VLLARLHPAQPCQSIFLHRRHCLAKVFPSTAATALPKWFHPPPPQPCQSGFLHRHHSLAKVFASTTQSVPFHRRHRGTSSEHGTRAHIPPGPCVRCQRPWIPSPHWRASTPLPAPADQGAPPAVPPARLCGGVNGGWASEVRRTGGGSACIRKCHMFPQTRAIVSHAFTSHNLFSPQTAYMPACPPARRYTSSCVRPCWCAAPNLMYVSSLLAVTDAAACRPPRPSSRGYPAIHNTQADWLSAVLGAGKKLLSRALLRRWEYADTGDRSGLLIPSALACGWQRHSTRE